MQEGIALESGIYIGVVFLLVLLCVIFHEYGHALMARRYGIETDDIILSPLFGVARIKQLPKTAFGEFWIAFAGPMVNIFIGLILLAIIFAASPQSILSLSQELWEAITLGDNRVRTSPHDYPVWTLILSFMMFVNLGLVVFNLVPCFPMDGGRMFRAGLHGITGNRILATRLSTLLGQILALTISILAIYYQQYGLILLGVFLYYMSMQEFKRTQNMEFTKLFKASDVMRKNYTTFSMGDDYYEVENEIFRGSLEKDFLIEKEAGEVIGVLSYRNIIEWTENKMEDMDKYIISDFPTITSDVLLYDILVLMNEYDVNIIPVLDNEEIKGVVDRNNIYHFLEWKRKTDE